MIEKIRSLPHCAGIYQYLDGKGRILYIGKAKNLSKRVKSYFNLTPQLSPKPTLSLRIQKMLSETASLHYLVVENEHDALILENSLIKQLKPKYNILLRDDKTYPYIYVNLDEDYPRFDITRKIIKGKAIRYFGPFSTGARDILDSLYELLPLVQKKSCLKGKKACLYYQMNQCLGPCEFPVDQIHYKSMVDTAASWIQNKELLIPKIRTKMEFYADELRFEEAKALRDRLERIGRSTEHSQIDLASTEAYDIFAIAADEIRGCIVRLFIRDGKIASSSHDFFTANDLLTLDEAYERALINYYGTEKPPIIVPILIYAPFESLDWVSQHLSQIFEKKASLHVPKQGIKKELTALAYTNALELLRSPRSDKSILLEQIAQLFGLETLPVRIEAFDNSHIGGQATVGAMIAYSEGNFDKKGYRTYHLEHKDEYSQMREMLTRRIKGFDTNPPPDLWVIDGGETLRSLAMELLYSNGTQIDVIGISKEKIDAKAHRAKGSARDILHSNQGVLRLDPSDKRLQFIQLLRDEAHRCAITFHKKSKLKEDKTSNLLTIPGITPGKVQKLLTYYGTFEAIAKAELPTLQELIGTYGAKNVHNYYNSLKSK
ncbi:MAG: excinuclease ABC subunit UvrC [Sulfuricurvum sp.]|nr:excinuclease ABC subunit UvrC [Sulfuricurvum sp.]MDP3022836.1 excinuclease ABC subunit UvrC [Sulfuricurvum sp.]